MSQELLERLEKLEEQIRELLQEKARLEKELKEARALLRGLLYTRT